MVTLQRAVTLGAAALVVATAAGCASTGSGGSSGSSGSKAGKVLVLYPYLGDQSYVREKAASVAQAKKHPDVTIDIKAGPNRTNVDFFLTEIGNAKTQGYSVIAINTGGTAEQLIPALNKATDQGVKVVSFDGAPPALKHLTSTVNYDNFGAAGTAGKEFMSLLPDGGDIGTIRCLAGLPDTDAFLNGFLDAIKGSNLKVVATGDAKCDPDQARTIAENMLTAHPDLVGIYDSVDVSAQGTLKAIQAAHAKAILGSIGGQEYALKTIATGTTNWKFTVPYPFEKIGAQAVDTAVELAQGKSVPAKVIIPPQPIATKDNADKVLATIQASISGASS